MPLPNPSRAWAWIAPALGLLVSLAALSGLGGPHDPALGLAVVLERLGRGAVGPALYLAASLGWGIALRPALEGSRRPLPVAVALGLALMASMTQVLGAAGALASAWGAWAPVAAGIALLAWRAPSVVRRGEDGGAMPRLAWGFVACAGAALAAMLVAACSPPGWLWGSEFGGYDALSYHLQLPREWLAGGRVWPAEHNAYSCLPGYAEAMFVHVARLGGGSTLAYSAQALHAGLAIVAACLAGAAARNTGASRLGATAAGTVLLAVPWTVVTGSMAYSEMGVLAMLAGALAVAWDPGLPPITRGAIVGVLLGVACGFKPTAIVLAAPAAGVVLLGASPRREWPGLLAGGALAGAAALAPWLSRNAIACGNPVFPYLHSVFGDAHWTPDQFARFAAGHRFDGSLLDRLALLVVPDRGDPARPGAAVHRGLLHPQFSIFFPLALGAIGRAIAGRSTRRPGLVLAAALAAQLVGWLAFTHLQSRFLLPLVVTGAVAIGVVTRGRIAWAALVGAAVLAGATLWRFAHERGGRPNATLVGGTALFDGSLWRNEWARASPARRGELAAMMGPEAFVNVALGEERVYLLGDATPFYFRAPVLYHTTWDQSPLGRLIREHPGEPRQWTAGLRARGVGLVLWNAGEVSRLQRSGWYDPTVTNDAIEAWLRDDAEPVQAWPDSGRYLFRLRPTP